jgi:hypothetical protein
MMVVRISDWSFVIITLKLTDVDCQRLEALHEVALQTMNNCELPVGKETQLALDRFAAQAGSHPVWHQKDDPQLRPKGE